MTDTIPSLTRAQMVEVDRLMVEEAGITLIQMMENAVGHWPIWPLIATGRRV